MENSTMEDNGYIWKLNTKTCPNCFGCTVFKCTLFTLHVNSTSYTLIKMITKFSSYNFFLMLWASWSPICFLEFLLFQFFVLPNAASYQWIFGTYSGYQSHAPSNDFFLFRKLCFDGRQSNVSMTITVNGVSRTIISVSILGVSELLWVFHLYLTRR